MYYRIVNKLTGYWKGAWESYDAADNYRLSLDDWDLWTVEEAWI